MGDRRKCQTYTASPAESGGLPVMLGEPKRFETVEGELVPGPEEFEHEQNNHCQPCYS